MSTPDSAQHTWTKEELESLTRRELVKTTKALGLKAGGLGATTVGLIEKILELQRQRSNLADAFPLPAEPSPEVLPEPSRDVLSGPSLEPSPEPSAELPQESRPSRVGLQDPQKAASPGSNPSQSQDSTSSGHLDLGTNTNPRSDKGKGKATETATAEQLKGPSGEISSSPTNNLSQPSTKDTSSEKKKKVNVQPRRPKHSTKPPRGGESSLPQNQEPSQNNDSQETLQVQQIVLPSDNSGSSLSNSNRTVSSVLSFQASFDLRLRKLETSASVESVRDQVTDLHKDFEVLKSELSTVKEQNAELKEENARVLEHNSKLIAEREDDRKEKADLNARLSAFNDRLLLLEEILKAKPQGSISSSTDLEGESAPRLGSPVDGAKTPKPDTTPKAPPRLLEGLELTSPSEHTTAQESNAPLSLPALPLPPPTLVGPVEIRPTPQPSSHTLPESRQYQRSSTPGGSHPSEYHKKRKLEEPGPGPSAARDTGVPSKRVKPNSSPKELVEDPASLQWVGEAVRGGLTTPPNLPPPNNLPVDPLNSRPDYPFNQGSPSPQQRRLPKTPKTPATRYRVPSPVRRPETQSSSTQPITPVVMGPIPGAPVQMMAIPVRGDHSRRTPEPTSSRAGPSHMVAPSALPSAVRGVFDPPSSSTPVRPGPSSHVMRTSTATSRPMTRARPYERLPPIHAPPPPPRAIPAAGPSIESLNGGGSQSSSSSNSDSARNGNHVPASAPVETVTGTESVRVRMSPTTETQLSGALDPFRFTGAIQVLRGQVNPPTPATPDGSMRQGAPETPMASPTRYGTEINPSMRHLY